MDIKQVVGLATALAARVSRTEYLAAGTILGANTIGTPSSITIPVNGVLINTAAGFQGLTLTASTVLARAATGDVAALSFAAFKTALAISDADLNLPQNFIYVGNASGKAAAVNPNTLPINVFAAPTANMALGNFTFTSSVAAVDVPPNGFMTKAQVEAAIAAEVSAGSGEEAPYVGTLTTGSMTLATLASAPTDAANVKVFVNGEYLIRTTHWTLAGAVISATPALNVAWGGTGSDGAGFAATDRIVVHFR